jgi:23S rRNA-/tRNA-specific pseudouridylate synthase
LGKYGYCHRRTAGERYRGGSLDMNVQGSMHYVFERVKGGADGPSTTTAATAAAPETHLQTNHFSCFICGRCFESRSELELHMAAPARPQNAELSNVAAFKIHDSTEIALVSASVSAVPDDATINGATKDQEDISYRSPCIPTTDRPTQQEAPPPGAESTIVVPVDSHGKRLRWFLQHNTTLSKRQADVAVQSGRVLINGVPVRDTSRLLKAGMTVVVCSAVVVASPRQSTAGQPHDPPPSTVVDDVRENVTVISRQFDPFLIVQKPSGMRTKGATIPGSLEFVVAEQQGMGYECLSRLDTSTSGLCALIPKTTYSTMTLHNKTPPPEIIHSMVALVHGRIPDDWSPHYYHAYSGTGAGGTLRKWKKRKHSSDMTESAGTAAAATELSSISISTTTSGGGGGMTIFPLERSGASTSSSGNSSLSTVRIVTTFPSAATICHVMRRLGYPVVGDTNCRREYLELKRSIRNRIKNKICLINHQVSFVHDVDSDERITVPPTPPPLPDKLSARYWDIHFGAGRVIAQTTE